MVGERRHPLLAQTPATPAAHTPSGAHRQHVVGVPGAGVPGVGVKLMQEPGFAAHDSHLYARGRNQPGRPQDVQLASRRQEEARRQRALSPGSQHSAAATFFARASQLAAPGTPSSCSSPVRQEDRERRRRRRRNSGERDRDGSGRRSKGGGREDRRALPTDYRGALARFSPPVPHALLKKIGTKDVQGLGKVRVVLRVSPAVPVGEGEEEVVTLDKRRRQVTLVEPQARQAQESRLGVAAPKMFAFDQVYTQEDPQSEVVSGAVVDVLHAVLAGNDGCVLCFGAASLGKTYTMLGSHTGPGELGVVPSAVAWLYRAIVEQKAKSGARFSVRVSAVAVDSTGAMLTDLLAEYAQEGEASPGALLRETTGGYLSSVAELRAPSPEAAAHYLDVAIAARSSLAPPQLQASQQQHQATSGSATLLYTLHIYQYSVDKSGKGGVVGGRSRLHMIDVGDLSGSGGGMSLSSLTSVLLAIFNGQRYLPNRESKLTMLLKEALGSVTCHAAMVVHVSPAPRHVQHTLATLQLASRVHRMRRKKLKGLGGSGSGGSSEGSHGKSSGETSAGSSSMDFSSSEQSCDTVIYIGGGGPGDTTDNEHPPVFMPHHTNQQVWPITRLRSMEHLRPHSASPTPAYTRRAASASPTPTSRSVPSVHPQVKPRPPPRTVSNANTSAGKAALGGGFIRHQPGVSHIAYNNNNTQQPLLSSFKPQVALGPLVPGDLRHFNYNAYEEPNNLVPMFQQSRLPISAQMQNQRQLEQRQQQQLHQQPLQQQQQQQNHHLQLQQQQVQQQQNLRLQKHQQLQKVQQIQHQQQQRFQQQLQQQPQNVQQLVQHQQYQQFQQLQQQNQKLIQMQHFQQQMQQHQQQQQQQQPQQQQQQQQQPQTQQQVHHLPKGAVDGVISDEQWIDGPRVHKSRVAAAQKIKTNKSETWVDGPQMTPMGYGFMDDHKKTMIERWVAVQTAQVVQQLEQQHTVPTQMPAQAPTTQQQFTHLTQFRTCEESTLDSDQDTLSEDPPSGPGRPAGPDNNLPPQPNLIEELERKNLIPAESSTDTNAGKPNSPQSELEALPKEPVLDEKSTEPHCSPDEASGADEPSIDDICSQCEALAEECEELSSLLSCEEEECKRQAHQGLATVLEEPELEADMVAEDQDKGRAQEEEEAEANGGEEATHTPARRGWVRRSVASSGTHHSTELIEVQVPDHPAITMDCCVQVCEEDILRALADTPCQSEVMSIETSDDHPLRVLSEENLTCASTFTDSYSQIGETGDEDDSDDDDSRPFSLFEVTDYGRVCQDLSLALQSDVANRNLHELAKIHDLYRTLARQSPRVHAGGPRLQAATLAEILTNSHDSLLEEKKPLEDDSICSEPAQAEGKLCRQCNKRQLRHGDSILRLESALRSKSQWLSRPLDTLEDSASDKCIGTEDLDFPEDHCTCDVQSDLVPYIPSMFFNFSPIHNPDSLSHSSLTRQASEASLRLMDAPLADSTEKLADRVPVNGVPLPEFIEDVEANVVLCNPVQYDYGKDDDLFDGNDDRTVTGKSDNESDCVSNISEDSEYMMQTSKLSKFLCVGVGKSKSKTPYKIAKQNNNKIIENKKNTAKLKDCKVKIPAKSRESSKSPDRNSKNLIKSPSRVVSQSAAKQSVSRRSDTSLSVRTRWGKSARVGASKPPTMSSRGNYRYTCTLMYPPDAATPTEGYDSGHDSGAATQGSATPMESAESWRTGGQGLPSHQHHEHHHHPAANSGSLGTNPSLGESSGYESIPRDSECSSFSSSQDSEMDDEHRREAQGHSSAPLQPRSQPKAQHPGGPAKVQVEDWSEEDVKRYEGRPCASEVPQLRAYRQQVLSLKSEQQALKADLAQAKGSLNVPAGSWSYERKSNYM